MTKNILPFHSSFQVLCFQDYKVFLGFYLHVHTNTRTLDAINQIAPSGLAVGLTSLWVHDWRL